MLLTDIEKKELDFFINKFDFSNDFRNKNILLTGAKGITGLAIIKWLLYLNSIKNANITIFASTRNPENIPSFIDKKDNIEFVKSGKEVEYLKDKDLDIIFQNAAPTSNKYFKEKPVESLNIILEGTKNALLLAKDKNAKVLYMSSEEAYGLTNSDTPISEDFIGSGMDSLNYRSCYPLGKKAAELLCTTYFLEYGVDVKIVRPSVIQGLTQSYDTERIDNEILRCILTNKNLVMKSLGLTKKCMVYTLDAVSAIFTVLFKGKSGDVYNISNPSTFSTMKDRVENLFSRFNNKLRIVFDINDNSVKQGYLPQRSLLLDVTKLRNLGWEPLADLYHIYEVDIERFKNSVR